MARWKLNQYLADHNITAYRLSAETKGQLSRTTVYELARGETTRLDLKTLDVVAATLKRLTGKAVTACDLLEVADDA